MGWRHTLNLIPDAAELCQDFGVGDLVQAIKIDSTQCVLPKEQAGTALAALLDESRQGAKCRGYPRESFDKVHAGTISIPNLRASQCRVLLRENTPDDRSTNFPMPGSVAHV
jgi:hypothetical protein